MVTKRSPLELTSNSLSLLFFQLEHRDDLTEMSLFRAEVLLEKKPDSSIFDSEAVEL